MMAGWLTSKLRGPQPTGQPRVLRSFKPGFDQPLSKDGLLADGNAWIVDAAEGRTVLLFELPDPQVEQCMLTYRARLKTEGLAGRAYLEMWCRLPGRGEFFSKGLDQTVKGTTDWITCEIPFYLKKGQRPDLIKLSIGVEGAGRVWMADLELLETALG